MRFNLRLEPPLDIFLDVLKSCGNLFDCSYVVADFTRDGRPLVYVNDAFLNLTGYAHDEVIHRNCRFLQGSDTNGLTVKQISECLKRGEAGWFDVYNYTKDGRPFWNRLTLIPTGGEIDPVRFYLGIQQDVTDLKESGQSIHEFGNLTSSGQSLYAPLMSILNASRSLKYFNDGSDKAREKIEELGARSRQEVAKIAKYVRDLG